MRNLNTQPSLLFVALLSSVMLTGCGAGSDDPTVSVAQSAPAVPAAPAANAPIDPPAASSAPIDPPPEINVSESGSAAAVPMRNPDPRSAPPPPTKLTSTTGPAVTSVQFENTGTADQIDVPVTFGHVFAPGHISSAHTVSAQLLDGTSVPLQVDVKARHADGSLRHAILTAKVARIATGTTATLNLSATAAGAAYAPVAPTILLNSGFTAAVNVTIGGVQYSASADELLRSGSYKPWMAGPIANEWLVSAPLKTAQGTIHPHLTARFAIRATSGAKQARVDVTVENGWAFEAAPQNFLYDGQVMVGGQAVYTVPGLNHLHHARWRKVFWWGAQPQVHVKHNTAYLINSRAVPNYDQSVVPTEANLAALASQWTAARSAPMAVGLAAPYMPTTGGRNDIGLMPGWAATYLLTQDKRAKMVTLGTADLAGSFSIHYRDKNTDRPVSIADYPYMTILGKATDTVNPVTKKPEAFPLCATTTACTTPNTADTSHQAAFAYFPYVVTGDYYYLEELHFWAHYNAFHGNPYYREFSKGLVKSDQVRAQAWTLRTVAEAAYITPDGDPHKAQFKNVLDHNLAWFNTTYANNTSANALGVIINGYALAYNGGLGLAPWQDDFFTSSLGHIVELGFENAKPMLMFKSKFPIARMTAPGACWIKGAIYSMNVRSSSTSTTLYPSMKEAYIASHTEAFNQLACNSLEMATALQLKVGEMTGYSTSETGFPSNMQPALAYSADVGGLAGANAWGVFAARTVKPDYRRSPQFAIVPR